MKVWKSLLTLAGVGMLLALGTAGDARPVPLSALPLPPIAAEERGEYRALDARTGVELWRTRWSLSRDPASPGPLVRVREEGAGLRGAPEPRRWTVSMAVSLGAGARRLSSERETRDAEGSLISSQTREIDFTGGTGKIVTLQPPTGRPREVAFPVSSDAVSADLLPTFFRVLPAVPGGEIGFDLVTRDGSVLPMTARIVGREMVTTPAGAFDCHKIELLVNGWRGQAAKLLLPRTFAWHTVAAPHMWVKYRGLDGGLGSPEVVMELTRFEPLAR